MFVPPPDLAEALAHLAVLTLNDTSLTNDLRRLARMTTGLVKASSSASIALVVDRLPTTVAVTDRVAFELDIVQFDMEQGPCLLALSGLSVRVALLAADERFPHFASGAADERVHSVLSTPIWHVGIVVGTLNIYSRHADAFDAEDEDVAAIVCAEAALALARSELLTQARDIRDLLQSKYDEQVLVERAGEVIAAFEDCSTVLAMDLLRNAAGTNRETLAATAQRILTEAASSPPEDAESAGTADGSAPR